MCIGVAAGLYVIGLFAVILWKNVVRNRKKDKHSFLSKGKHIHTKQQGRGVGWINGEFWAQVKEARSRKDTTEGEVKLGAFEG